MTKRRPWWSDWRRQVAALACGLLLLDASSALAATHGKSPAKARVSAREASCAQGKTTSRSSAKSSAKSSARSTVKSHHDAHHSDQQHPPTEDFGPADLADEAPTGLHGHASFYGNGFLGRRTATGERFDPKLFTGASNHFPLGSLVAVRRVDNDRCAVVKINDRMHAKHRRRIIDVSRGVAEYLDMLRAGVVFVRVAPFAKGREADPEACRAAFGPTDGAPPPGPGGESDGHGKPEKLPEILSGSTS